MIKAKHPAWKPTIRKEKERKALYIYGGPGDGMMLRIFRGDSRQQAADEMRRTLDILSGGPGRRRADIGDEAYSWESERGSSAGVRFRKANLYVDLTATSAATVEEITRGLVSLILDE